MQARPVPASQLVRHAAGSGQNLPRSFSPSAGLTIACGGGAADSAASSTRSSAPQPTGGCGSAAEACLHAARSPSFVFTSRLLVPADVTPAPNSSATVRVSALAPVD